MAQFIRLNKCKDFLKELIKNHDLRCNLFSIASIDIELGG